MHTQLSFQERKRIAQLLPHRCAAQIAQVLGRARSTITRELARNSGPGGYCAVEAQRRAQRRRQHRPRKLDDPKLNAQVRRGLAQQWSPDQIAGRLPGRGPRRQRPVSPMTIYRWIDRDESRDHWRAQLRSAGWRKRGETRGKLPAQARIADRPAVVRQRQRFGDWEGDTIVSAGRHGGLVSLVERKSGLVLLGQVKRLRARSVRGAIQRRVANLPRGLRRTLTLDNGKEFAEHQQLADATGLDAYFARPYHAWERGTCENTNGLVRQYFPKGTDFRHVSPREIRYVQNLLNDRPRKRLGYRTPREALRRYFAVATEM